MDLGERIRAHNRDWTKLRFVDGYYNVEEDGYKRPTPVLYLHGRTADGEYAVVRVDDYRPYFGVPRDMDEDLLTDLDTDRRVLSVEPMARDGYDQTPLFRVETEQPWHVKELRDPLHEQGVQTYEADVRFVHRFLTDGGLPYDDSTPIYDGFRVPDDDSSEYLYDGESTQIEPVDSEAVQDIAPRVCNFDIEVEATDGFPSVDTAQQTVTAITARDSYGGDYRVWALTCPDTDSWDPIEGEAAATVLQSRLGRDRLSVVVFDDERTLLSDFIEYLLTRRFDVLTGWNADSFDVPYIVNRCFELELFAIQDLSPTRDIERHDNGGSWVNSDVHGVHVFDLLAAYEKSQYTELQSSKLEDVAAAETDLEKLDVDEQTAWEQAPLDFMEYNIRDVGAAEAINQEFTLLT